METFTCSRCNEAKPVNASGGTGYAVNSEGGKVCYSCCADIDRARMLETGRATLYLSPENRPTPTGVARYLNARGDVRNWPGTLRFPFSGLRVARHNIAGRVYTAYFTGPDGATWSARNYGEHSDIAHCRRLKSRR